MFGQLGRFVLPVMLGGYVAAAWANCPVGVPNEIFCDDFDTYCSQSAGGHPGDPHCPTSGATAVDQRLKEVWLREPRGEDSTETIVENNQQRLWSAPYGGRYPCQGDSKLGTMTIRDWVNSPPGSLGDPGQIRNLAWRIQQIFGPESTAVVGTDDQPLILNYMVDGGGSDKIDWGNGYIEVTLDDGDEASKLDRANTDYADSPNCNTYCDPYIQLDPMPILCAQGNPDTTTAAMPQACPNVNDFPPPIRHSIAAGVVGLLDTDPCHCGSTTAHGPVNFHLNVFDGQKWWMLRTNNPRVSTGFVTDRNGNVLQTWPSTLGKPGHFELYGGTGSSVRSQNFVTLTIRSTTFDVHLATFERDALGDRYWVHSDMVGLPRAYLGAFNSLRMGVGQGCQILGKPDDPWACGGGNTRPLRSRANGAGTLAFDDLYLHGGAPIVEEGACCHPDATCSEVLADQCDGIFRGRSTFCSSLTAACCPAIYGDTDADGDTDIADFAELQRCMTTIGTVSTAPCKCLDFNSSGTVDNLDIEHFISCANGPDVAGNSAPPCKGVGW